MQGNVINDIVVTPIGRGFMSDLARVAITSSGGDLPDAIILKLAAASPERRRQAVAYGSYARESAFYQHLAPTLNIRTPKCYLNLIAADGTRMALGLEDMHHWQFVNPIKGANRTQTLLAMQTAATMQAPFWQQETQGQLYRDRIPTFADTFDLAIHDFNKTVPACFNIVNQKPAPRIMRLLEHHAENPPGHLLALTRTPQTLMHTDYRLDNMCFARDDSTLALFDWGDYCIGPPGFDLALFLGCNLDMETRRALEPGAIRCYHDTLVAQGITGFTQDDCLNQYRLCLVPAFYLPAFVALASAAAGKDARQQAATLIARGIAAISDHLDWLEHAFLK